MSRIKKILSFIGAYVFALYVSRINKILSGIPKEGLAVSRQFIVSIGLVTFCSSIVS